MFEYKVNYRYVEEDAPSVDHLFNYVIEANNFNRAESIAYDMLIEDVRTLWGRFTLSGIKRCTVTQKQTR